MSYLKRKFSLLTYGISLILAVAILGGCSKKNSNKKTADLVYVNWAEGIAYTNLAKEVLQDKMGYDVTITSADVAPAYTAVAQGNKDAFMESWLPTLHKDYVDRFKNKIVDLGIIYSGTQSGLVVPAYVPIDSISQLNANADKFNDQIVGIDAGAGIMKTTQQVIDDYNLKLKLVPSSGPAMTSALKKAIDHKEWIVVTGWKPHWMFGQWDLKFLKQDPDKEVWKKGNIHIFGRKNLKEDKPELAKFLSNMHLTDDQISDLMLKERNSDKSEEAVAKEWMQNHPQVIESWIPKNETAMK